MSESECDALLASVKILEYESARVAGRKAGMRTIDWENYYYTNARVAETDIKYRQCRIKLARSKSPCDEKEIRYNTRQILRMEGELKLWNLLWRQETDKTRGKNGGEACMTLHG